MFIQSGEVYRCHLKVTNVFPDYTFSTYEGETNISIFTDDENYHLLLSSRTSSVYNPKESTADQILIELGECMFPISLKIDNHGKLLEVENFEEIKKRRIHKSEEIAKVYPIAELKKYLKISMLNLRNEECFRKKFESNLFLQILTNSLFPKKSFIIRFDNFPTTNKCNYFLCKAIDSDLKSVKYNVTTLTPFDNGDVLEGDVCILLENSTFKETQINIKLTKEGGDSFSRKICLHIEKCYLEENKEDK